MDKYRKVRQVVKGHATEDGAGVKLTRVLGDKTVEDFDPFLMLDAFDSSNPSDYIKGFPWHPHRGIETVTYLISGDMEHGDSMGNSGNIRDGETQWMTAGSGIIHQEMPKPTERMQGVQLWINLPANAKMTEPEYHSIGADDVPQVQEMGIQVKVIAGKYQDTQGGFEGNYVKANYFDVRLDADLEWRYESDPEKTLFVYLYDGNGYFEEDRSELFEEKSALLFSKGERVSVKAGVNGVRFLLLEALPLGEPVAWGGPIVMNTREELTQAFDELEDGTFVKHAKK